MTDELDDLVLAVVRAEEALVAAREAYVRAGGSWMWSKQHAHARLLREGGDVEE